MTIGIRWLSLLGGGYEEASDAYLSGLRAAGIPVSWTPLGWPSRSWNTSFGPLDRVEADGHVHRDIAYRQIEHDTLVVHSLPWWHERLRSEADGRPLIAYTTWETDRLPAEWVESLNRYDRVLVPSRFNATVFESSGVVAPVRVVAHVARQHRPTPLPPNSGGKYVFYVIATWTSRKAILDAVSAYLHAFTADDDVVLLIHTTRADLIACARLGGTPEALPERETWFSLAKALAGQRGAPEITLSTRTLTRGEVDALHTRGDCFLLLSHGEGWGLGAFEAAAAGNPVIVTGWGGTCDFLPGAYPYCVDYDLEPTISAEPDEWWAPREGEYWAKARIAHAAKLMRQVFEQRDEARRWGGLLQSHVREFFSEERVIRDLLDALV
jgi:glycosyltransferase involved in cell wall biosynthesis